MTQNFFAPLQENCFYHIYNRGNNGDNLFYKTENYHYFLRKYDAYLSDYLETYAYSLMPNHFHIVARVKEQLREAENRRATSLRSGTSAMPEPDKIVSEAFRRFFTSYAKSINKQENRTGSLFQKNFKRKIVTSERYFCNLIHYVHFNPQNHGIIDDFRFYPHSSYERMLNDKPTKLFKKEVLEWFGSKENYISFHHQDLKLKEIKGLIIEED